MPEYNGQQPRLNFRFSYPPGWELSEEVESDYAEVVLDGPEEADPDFGLTLSIAVFDAAPGETNLRVLASTGAGGGNLASLLKIRGTEIEQAINQTLVDALGNYGVPYDVNFPRVDRNEPPAGPDYATGLMAENLLKRASSIYGGTNEIQRNIIAKMVLAL